MSSENAPVPSATSEGDKKGTEETPKKLKPCCACPETKRPRDEWYIELFSGTMRNGDFVCLNSIVEKGEENCRELIEAHLECMRKLGFNL